MASDPGSLTLAEAADRLGVHYMTVYHWVRLGRLRTGFTIWSVCLTVVASSLAFGVAKGINWLVQDLFSITNVYVSSWDWPGFLSRFTPKPGAEPAKLIGQKLGTKH